LQVPNLLSFVKDDLDRKAVSLVTSQQIFSRPYVAPPGVPAQQVKILREAFAAVLRDPKFLADAAVARLSIAPVPGERLQEIVAELYGTAGNVVQRARHHAHRLRISSLARRWAARFRRRRTGQ
jgi:hypothetical protein